MDSFVYMDEIGTEPYAYIGYERPRADTSGSDATHKVASTTATLEIQLSAKKVKHRVFATVPTLELQFNVAKVIHKVYTNSNVSLGMSFTIYKAKHILPNVNKYNAPVSPACDTYLNTPYASRYLETPSKIC